MSIQTATFKKKNDTPVKGKIFLTGGSGLVGKNIREHPRSANWAIFAPTRQELDLTNATAVFQEIREYRPDIIIHAAGLVGGIKANISDPVNFLDANVIMGRNVLMTARECKITKLINLGSSCMYPHSIHGPLTEDKILTGELEPTNEGYALAKLFTTKLCQYICQENSSMLYKTLIPCNLYGKYDKFDPGTAHLLPAIIQKIHNAKVNDLETVIIWGKGTARREFLYAGDLADAILQAVEDLNGVPDLMNVGVGLDYSINEYYQIVAEIMGWRGSFKHDMSMPVGVPHKLCALDRQQKWGWKAQTSLRIGIKKTYQHFLESYSQ